MGHGPSVVVPRKDTEAGAFLLRSLAAEPQEEGARPCVRSPGRSWSGHGTACGGEGGSQQQLVLVPRVSGQGRVGSVASHTEERAPGHGGQGSPGRGGTSHHRVFGVARSSSGADLDISLDVSREGGRREGFADASLPGSRGSACPWSPPGSPRSVHTPPGGAGVREARLRAWGRSAGGSTWGGDPDLPPEPGGVFSLCGKR